MCKSINYPDTFIILIKLFKTIKGTLSKVMLCSHQHCSHQPHLSILMVNKQVPCTLIFLVGNLQTMSMTNLLWLKFCIQVLHADDRFGNLGL